MGNEILQKLKLLSGVIEQENEPEAMMQAFVSAARTVFRADNAWLLYPCIAGGKSCSIPFFSCNQGVTDHKKSEVLMTDALSGVIQELTSAGRPLIFNNEHCQICVDLCDQQNRPGSQILMILDMKNDRPWLFGICEYSGRGWSEDDQDIFQLAGERLRYAYDTARFQETVQRDIAKRQKVEAEILRSEQRFRSLFEQSSVSLLMFDIAQLLTDAGRSLTGDCWKKNKWIGDQELEKVASMIRIVDINSATIDLFAAHDKNNLLNSLKHILTDASRLTFKEIILDLLYGKKHFLLETELRTLEGGMVSTLLNIDVLPPPDSHLVLISFTNITEIKAAEEMRQLLSTAVEQSAESVVITNPQGIIEYVNPAYERVTGYTKKEIIGRTPSILKSGEMPAYQYRLLWQEITAGRVWCGKLLNRKKDGTTFTEDVIITPVKDGQGEISHFVAVKRDVTRQDQLEHLVRQSQKMQAIGTLAGGIAHDFNNILTAILGFAELSIVLCEENQMLKSNLVEIVTAAERAGHLTDQILTFSRQTEKSVSTVQIEPIVKEVLKLLRASLPANIEIVPDIKSDEAMVRADPTQIHQVVMNLCTNAFQAIGDKNGIIEVVLSTDVLGDHQGVELGNLPAGEYVTLSVLDNGRGIAREQVNRIFEPYFTTREKNEGTGLGLSVVHGIVNDHAGAIDVQTTPGKGSCFTVYLPRIKDSELKPQEEEVEFLKGEGKILVVDDELQIVDYEVQALEKAGYVTFATTSSTEALSLFKKRAQTLDLVITDMAMPDLTGLQLFQEIRKINKEIPVLLCTGYSEHVTADSSREMGIDGYLAKPFTAEQLAAEVFRILYRR